MRKFRIGEREIGDNQTPFVIAEVGINHEGDFEKAKKMIDAAIEAGADCVKFQCHITDKEMIPTDIKPGKISKEKLWEIIKRCELTVDEEYKLKRYCEDKGIIYLCTPFSKEAAERLYQMGVLAFKIGSGECNNLPFLEYIARMGKPMILSTGMNDIYSIRKSVNIILKYKCPFMLMHCTSIYPTPYERVRLGAIKQLRDIFKVPVGLSDHSLGIYTCLAAVALGASAIEKHFTISRKWPGPDNPISIEPNELRELVKGVRAIFQARGGKKDILKEEMPVIKFAYASVVTIKDIKKGEKFSVENIWVKRPGTGELLAKDFKKILGKVARRDLPKDRQLKINDVVW